MSDSKSRRDRPGTVPQTALDIALQDKAGTVLRRAMWLETLDQQLRPLLPANALHHCRLANVTDRQLVFVADSPVWHARLRLIESELLNAAHTIGLTATRVAIKTTRNLSPSPVDPAGGNPLKPSAATQKRLQDVLASLQPPHSDQD
ncbi:MAG: DUF721 domain-containing protein [Xanthomonadaceae bacterium]|jgi:hypothetical protein|nr:DUF721 domain-containing protein [Xanthomonadaceae bacterium]